MNYIDSQLLRLAAIAFEDKRKNPNHNAELMKRNSEWRKLKGR